MVSAVAELLRCQVVGASGRKIASEVNAKAAAMVANAADEVVVVVDARVTNTRLAAALH